LQGAEEGDIPYRLAL